MLSVPNNRAEHNSNVKHNLPTYINEPHHRFEEIAMTQSLKTNSAITEHKKNTLNLILFIKRNSRELMTSCAEKWNCTMNTSQ